MDTFKIWLRTRAWDIVLFVLVFALCRLVFWLYNLAEEALDLALALCLIVAAVFAALDYIGLRRRCNQLAAAQKNGCTDLRQLPAVGGIEGEYVELLRELSNSAARLRAEAAVRRGDMDEYYTLWAHQIKTPIAAARLLLQAEGETLDEESLKRLKIELFHIEQYVELAMNYQRLEGDGSDLVIKRQSLDGIIRSAVRKFSRQFIYKGLSMDYTPTDVQVLTDEKWLCFVIEQVLSNALKYTREGGIKIYMRTEHELVTEDSGIGISPEDLPRIFERGFTGYNGRSDKKSTGIGLYLCRRTMARLGHAIRAESVPGEGTKIILDLSASDIVLE